MTDNNRVPENGDATRPPEALNQTVTCECGQTFHQQAAYRDHKEDCPEASDG